MVLSRGGRTATESLILAVHFAQLFFGQRRSRLSTRPRLDFRFRSPLISRHQTANRDYARFISFISVFAPTPPEAEMKADQLRAP